MASFIVLLNSWHRDFIYHTVRSIIITQLTASTIDMNSSLKVTSGRGRPKNMEKKALVLRAAATLFMQRGFKGTSMNAVARESGVSKQTLYSHFNDKENLFSAVIRWKLAQHEFTPQKLIFKGVLAADLRLFGFYFLKLIMDPEAINMTRMVIGESREHPTLARLFYASGPTEVIVQLETYLQSQGVDNPRARAVNFLNMLHGERHMRQLMGLEPLPIDQPMEAFVDEVVTDFMRQIQASS